MSKRMFLSAIVLTLSILNVQYVFAGAAAGGAVASFDYAAELAKEGATPESVAKAALAAGEDATAIAKAFKSNNLAIDVVTDALVANNVPTADIVVAQQAANPGITAEALTFTLVTAGVDSAEVVNAVVANVDGASADSLATTLITANANLRVATTGEGETTRTTTRTTSTGSGSPLTTEQFITTTQEANS